EPQRQGLARILENRPSRHRTLVAATRALQKGFALRPTLPPTATRAAKPVRPAELKQILPAGLLRREASLKFQQISWKVLHRRPYYRLWLPESSKYPPAPNFTLIS